MADASVSVRPFSPEDLPAVLDLLRASLGESALLKRTPELFVWKHIDNPFGPSIMFVSHDGGTITGFRAFMRWDLVTPSGRTLRCVRAVDTATHPDHRRRGIFKRLTLAAVDAASQDGIDLVFNTPNPRSGAGYLTMGWTEVGRLSPLISPARGVLRRAGNPLELPEVSDFVTKPDPVGVRSTPDRDPLGLRTLRSPHYHQWRFTAHPTARYVEVNGNAGTAIARLGYRSTHRELLISDVYGDGMRATINRCRNVARTRYVAAYFSKGSPERAAALRAGMIQLPAGGLTLMVRPLTDLGLDASDLGSWDLSLSDLELL